jgi:hypothetical protein
LLKPIYTVSLQNSLGRNVPISGFWTGQRLGIWWFHLFIRIILYVSFYLQSVFYFHWHPVFLCYRSLVPESFFGCTLIFTRSFNSNKCLEDKYWRKNWTIRFILVLLKCMW